METFIRLEPFSVCGLGLDCPGDDTSGIDALWDLFLARQTEVAGTALYGVSHSRSDGFYYVAGLQCAPDAPLPPGMECTGVPGGEYFRLPFQGDPKTIAAAFDRIFDELLPALGRQAAEGACCLEAYPAEGCWDPATGTMRLDLYVQVV